MSAAWLLLAASLLLSPAPAARAGERAAIPGLRSLDHDCQVGGHRIELRELRLDPGKDLELRAVANPGAHPDPRCRDGYGGPDLQSLIGAHPEILGAANGTLFRETGGRGGKPLGYASNSLIWTKGVGLLAPWRKGGGSSILVVDPKGGHRFEIDAKRTADIPIQLLARFPDMTVAVQSNLPLMDGKDGAFEHWSRCPDPQSSDWRCRPHARTLVCARTDGSVSLLTSPSAYPYDLANGLRVGGACRIECALLYNLDGGRSTQMARPEAIDGGKTRLEWIGQRIETTQEGCTAYRPVNNYLVIVRKKSN